MKKSLPSQHYLQFHFEYDPETGVFSRNGKELGSYLNGYLVVQIDCIQYRVHRLIWRYMTGEEPDQIDHINRIKDDNRWCNLRNVDQTTNIRNNGGQKNGCGVVGICYRPERGKWVAQIYANKRLHNLGYFLHPLDAIQARIEAEEIFWGKSHVHTNLK